MNSAKNTTTYIILGCVIGGIVIIVAVILILYCGKWEWLQRLKGRGSLEPQKPQLAFQQPVPQERWPKSIRKKLKLRFGGMKQNPYSGTVMSPAPNSMMIGSSGFVLPENRSLDRQFVVGQDTSRGLGFESSISSPYVATLAINENDHRAPLAISGGNIPVGGSVIQLGGAQQQQMQPYQRSASLSSLNMLSSPIEPAVQPMVHQAYQRPASPHLHRHEINLPSQLPSQPVPAIVHQHYTPQPISQPMAVEANVIPHTHAVYPTSSIYPSLGGGHGHTHAAPISTLPSYAEALPRKF